jgi:hypothetical protein
LNQRQRLKHNRELITDVEHQTQFVTEEQDVVKRTNNEHTAHNFEQYNLLLEWLDGRADLLKRLLMNTELYYTSIRKWAAARTNKDEGRKKKYYIQHGEHKQHVEVLQRNIDEHRRRIPSVTLLPEEQLVTEETESSERPTTRTRRRRTGSIPGAYIQSPQYHRTRRVDPADNETGESSEKQRQEEHNPEEERSKQEEKDKRTTEEKDNNMSDSDSGNKQELKGVRIPNPKTLTGDGDDRGAKRVNTWINRVQDWIEITNTSEPNKPRVLQYFLEGSALDFYQTKRQAAKAKGPKEDLNVDES